MRLRFSDTSNLKQRAKENLESGLAQLRRWWAGKYKLPPNHSLFEGQSTAELTLEYFEDLMVERQGIRARLDDEDRVLKTDEVDALFARWNEIQRALDEPEEVQDDLIDEWERELEAGRIPDLDKR